MPGPVKASRTVLIVENRASIASVYRAQLEAEGYTCELYTDQSGATVRIREISPLAVLLSLELTGCEPANLIAGWVSAAPATAIIVVAANASINAAVEAVRAGAWDYLVKPVSRNRLLTTLANVCNTASSIVNSRTASAPARMQAAAPALTALLGSSQSMAALQRQIIAIAGSAAPAFITGESGTGKELCAQAIHDASPRARKPFIALNCGAIPRDLMESEIFGHLKGAFTGAIADREGAAAAADGGTLFLDEVCEMDLQLQTKLLRFLQTGTIQPVGSPHTRKVDIRIICATNRNPQTEVAQGRFRDDLFFRLHVLPVALTPLRERGSDVSELACHFLADYAREEGKLFSAFTPPALGRLMAHHWPGNVRELQNAIRQAVVLHEGELLEEHMLPDHIGMQINTGAPGVTALLDGRLLWQIEREVIETAIRRFAGSIPKAASALGVSPSTIYRKRESWSAMAF